MGCVLELIAPLTVLEVVALQYKLWTPLEFIPGGPS